MQNKNVNYILTVAQSFFEIKKTCVIYNGGLNRVPSAVF